MKKAHQYTIRNVSQSVHRALSLQAAGRKVSLNTLLVGVLEREAGLADQRPHYDDLDGLIGSWIPDRAVDKALREQRKVNPGDWD